MKSHEVILISLFSAMIFLALLLGLPIGFLKINIAGTIVLIAKSHLSTKNIIIALVIALLLNYLLVNSAAGIPIDQIAFFIAALAMLYVFEKTSKLWIAVIVTTILMTLLNFLFITPFYLSLTETQTVDYLSLITSKNYIISILTIYPLFNLVQWTLVAVLYKIYQKAKK